MPYETISVVFLIFFAIYFRSAAMNLDTDDLVTSSLIAFLVASVVFVFSIKAFRSLFPDSDVSIKGLSSHIWVEKPTYIVSVSLLLSFACFKKRVTYRYLFPGSKCLYYMRNIDTWIQSTLL